MEKGNERTRSGEPGQGPAATVREAEGTRRKVMEVSAVFYALLRDRRFVKRASTRFYGGVGELTFSREAHESYRAVEDVERQLPISAPCAVAAGGHN